MTDDTKPQKTISVDVQYSTDGKGNCGNGRYLATAFKYRVHVNKHDTQLIYQLSDATPAAIGFTGYTASVPGQLGPATISNGGRTMTIVDADTDAPMLIEVTLLMADNFGYDPEVSNDPVPMPEETASQ